MGSGVFLLGYDVESGATNVTGRFLEAAWRLHEELKAPATLYVVGQIAARHQDALSVLARHDLFDVGQHTFSHMLLKTICTDRDGSLEVVRGGTPEAIQNEVRRASDALEAVTGVRPLGLTGPYGYYRGLRDRPDLLQILHDEGIRYLRTFGRDAHDWQPVALDHQPFWYGPQGFDDMLELLLHGWQDCILREQLGWDDRAGYASAVFQWLADAASRDAVFSYVQHDWSSLQADPGLDLTRAIVERAQDLGMRVLTARAYYDEMRAVKDHTARG